MELNPVFSVSELNEYVGTLLTMDDNLANLSVRGEISGLRKQSSGHIYFVLKDAESQVRCVMFKQNVLRLRFIPRDGMQVTISGYASLYERDGSFQVYAVSLAKEGEGDLYRQYLRQKEELERLGWFDAEHKKAIPSLPRCVGVVTSPTGAALQDIKKVLSRRFSNMPLVLYPSLVQGDGAEDELSAAINKASREKRCDVLIVGRGGGSMEDLWAFNLMKVVQSVHECEIPVISAVGHETDFTLTDFVADLRAPTPSAAAELAVPELDALLNRLASVGDRLMSAVQTGIMRKRERLSMCAADKAFVKVEHKLDGLRQRLSTDKDLLIRAAVSASTARRASIELMYGKLSAYDPKRTLMRGFAFVTDEGGAVVAKAEGIDGGQALNVNFIDGAINVIVKDVGKADGRNV
ncbi:MAG TPA: exodeoxyribonuclease VII large subunit [Clostridia bacterium]|nr:exodeoxyribonuclease VII large subunit [Clostridia bacterium]